MGWKGIHKDFSKTVLNGHDIQAHLDNPCIDLSYMNYQDLQHQDQFEIALNLGSERHQRAPQKLNVRETNQFLLMFYIELQFLSKQITFLSVEVAS